MTYNVKNYSLENVTPIIELFEKAHSISCKPDQNKFPKVRDNDVIDEEKSVRWNREEVTRLKQKYKDEVTRLNTVRNKAVNDVENLVKDLIIDEIKHSVKNKSDAWYKHAANSIYNTAYANSHHNGMYDVLTNVINYLDLVINVINFK